MAGSILALVLAAGKGSRMRSAKAKVLQLVGGRTMIEHVLATVAQVGVARQAVVFGHEGEALQKAVAALPFSVSWVAQEAQLGTGHAVLQALDLIGQYDLTLVLLGDVPLVGVKTLQRLCASAAESGFAVLTAKVVEPFGYGRIVRDECGAVVAIVEEKEADEAQRAIDEVNTGIMAISRACLQAYLPRLSADNAQGEFYLTDLIALARADGQEVSAVRASSQEEVLGVNDRAQLAQAEAVYRKRQAQALLDAGATLVDPLRVDIQGSVSVGRDVVIEANVVFKGKVVLGDGVVVESGCVLIDCEVGAGSVVLSHSRIEGAILGQGVQVGPFARLRPSSNLADGAKVGNFVELKAATVGAGSKVNHLSYVGDCEMGAGVNIGAGVITCNYDGVHKYKTVIGDGAFVGSNSALVAPVVLGAGATIGAGSVISGEVAAQALALTRPPLRVKMDWVRGQKKTKNKE